MDLRLAPADGTWERSALEMLAEASSARQITVEVDEAMTLEASGRHTST